MVQPSSLVESFKHLSCMLHDKVQLLMCAKPTSWKSSKGPSQLYESGVANWQWGKWFGSITCFWLHVSWLKKMLGGWPHARTTQGALTAIVYFSPCSICFCSMHALNLGYGLWVGASTLMILVEHIRLYGGDEVDMSERYKTAWLNFDAWCRTNRLQHLSVNVGMQTALLDSMVDL